MMNMVCFKTFDIHFQIKDDLKIKHVHQQLKDFSVQNQSPIWDLRNGKIDLEKSQRFQIKFHIHFYQFPPRIKQYSDGTFTSWIVAIDEEIYLHSQYIITNPIYTTNQMKPILIDMKNIFEECMKANHKSFTTIYQCRLDRQDDIIILDILEDHHQMYESSKNCFDLKVT